MENADEIESNLANLIEAGFQLAIDDFGTGYCSLAYLPRLQVATLKLDRSFTQGLATNQATTAIVRSVIGLGHELGIKITAEGVETQEQQAWLVQAGCDRLQGYLFSRPCPRRVCPQLPAAGAVSQQQQGHPRVALLFCKACVSWLFTPGSKYPSRRSPRRIFREWAASWRCPRLWSRCPACTRWWRRSRRW